jgi:archaemetzincin
VRVAAHLEIVALGEPAPPGELLRWLAEELRSRFGFTSVQHQALAIDPAWREQEGERLSSNRVVDALVDRAERTRSSHEQLWTLAVTSLDLAAPGRDYVFGEATLGGGWAILSTARLVPPTDPRVESPTARRRVLVEAVHELGHLAGLPHCDSPACAMNPSTTAEDTDGKHLELCTRCAGAGPSS